MKGWNVLDKQINRNILDSSYPAVVNIKDMKNKSIWLIRKIFTKLYDLNLKKYFFECAIVFLNIMLQSSILYACKTYYYLKESEVRQFKRIEESYLNNLTLPGIRHIPARFEIKKSTGSCHESHILKFLKLQKRSPTSGDLAKVLEIDRSLEGGPN